MPLFFKSSPFSDNAIERCQATGFCDNLCLFNRPKPTGILSTVRIPQERPAWLTSTKPSPSSGVRPSLDEMRAIHDLWVDSDSSDNWIAAVVSLSTTTGFLLLLLVVAWILFKRYYRQSPEPFLSWFQRLQFEAESSSSKGASNLPNSDNVIVFVFSSVTHLITFYNCFVENRVPMKQPWL